MNKLERRFQLECIKSPDLSTIVNYGRAVEYQRYSQFVISRGLKQLVDSDDYQSSDLEDIIEHLVRLSHSERPLK